MTEYYKPVVFQSKTLRIINATLAATLRMCPNSKLAGQQRRSLQKSRDRARYSKETHALHVRDQVATVRTVRVKKSPLAVF